MISKAKIKWIHSLELKKNRQQGGCFLAEGNKLVEDLLFTSSCRYLAAVPGWLDTHREMVRRVAQWQEVTRGELEKASLMQSPQEVLAVFDIPEEDNRMHIPEDRLCLALDNVQDPGNMGTILRIADWFGIEDIFCSPATADAYNPKVVQASMGAIGRVHVHYTDLPSLLRDCQVPVYGTFIDGDNIYDTPLTPMGVIVMGNEGNGVSREVAALSTRRLFIPNYPAGRSCSESLNVSTAAAIVCAEFRRRFP